MQSAVSSGAGRSPPQTGSGVNIMALFRCPDCNGKVSTEAERCPHCGRPVTEEDRKPKPESKKGATWQWIPVCIIVLIIVVAAGWRIHKGYFPKSVDKDRLYSTVDIYAKDFCYRDLPRPSNKREGFYTEPKMKWTHCSPENCEVWVILDGPVTMERAETLANKLTGHIIYSLEHESKISKLQLRDEKCLIRVFVLSKDFSNGERYIYGGTIHSYANSKDNRWINGYEVKSLFSNSLPVEF